MCTARLHGVSAVRRPHERPSLKPMSLTGRVASSRGGRLARPRAFSSEPSASRRTAVVPLGQSKSKVLVQRSGGSRAARTGTGSLKRRRCWNLRFSSAVSKRTATKTMRPLHLGQPSTSRPKLCFSRAAQPGSSVQVAWRSGLGTSVLRRLAWAARTQNGPPRLAPRRCARRSLQPPVQRGQNQLCRQPCAVRSTTRSGTSPTSMLCTMWNQSRGDRSQKPLST